VTTPTRRLPAACFHVLLSLGDEPRHGLGIMDEVERATGGAVLLGPGSVYGSLKRLADDRLVRESRNRPGEDDPRRRYYEITAAGREALQSELRLLSAILDSAREKDVLPETSS